MKNEMNHEGINTMPPPKREVIHYPVLGWQIFIIALLFSNVNITYIILLMIGAILFTSILKNRNYKTN